MDLMGHSEPSFKRLTSPSYGQPSHVGNAFLESLGKPHVESFNFMLDDGLKLAIHDLERVSFEIPQNNCQVSLWIIDGRIEPPSLPPGVSGVLDYRIWPTESRQRGASYKGRMVVRVGYSVNGVTQPCLEKDLGRVPVMLRSKACHLHGLSPAQLVKHGEQETEWGGYFVIGGHERIIRMLLTTRRNYPVALQRPSWKNRGRHFSDLGIQIDCCKPDMTTVKNVLHFVNTGTAKFMFNIGKELFFVPVIMVLKCLSSRSDAEVYRCLMQGVAEDDYYYQSCLRNMFSEPQEEGLYSPDQIRAYIGGNFRERLRYMLPDSLTNEEVCDYLVRRSILIHLVQPEDKFQLLVFMVKKLFALVQDKCVVEGVDAIMMQEVVLGGHLYLQLIKEKLQAWLDSLKFSILKRFSVTSKSGSASSSTDLTPSVMTWCMNKTLHLEKMFENFIATGNLPTKSGLGLMQDKGITIMAENINRMRYMSHFRAVHRGSFFQEMRTTEVRALLPDAWGFVCPVHTPDGAPCGLLNHLALPVQVVSHPADVSRLVPILVGLGMEPVETFAPSSQQHSTTFVDVMLDGRIVGWVNRKRVAQLVDKLRLLKIDDQEVRVPQLLEVVLIPQKSNSCPGQFSGLFLFSGAARMMRPVLNLAMNKIEYIGTLEQVYMEIALTKEESYAGVTSHMELSETAFMSNLAQTIPLPDFNQSPRNMYQCQMGKQTMATPTHTWHSNSETKIYRLQTPMSPFFRPYHYDRIALDDYPMGTNAIVAVISYTGYDMEDAMIINKSSYERGFAAGSIYKAKFVDLVEEVVGKRAGADRASVNVVFERDPTKAALAQFLDQDGLPYIGTRLTDGDPFYCYRNEEEGVYKVKQYDGKEMVFVDSVKLCGDDLGTAGKNRACICVRVPRNPSVGDKFASRAGQKGICSRKWECEDLPWTESGLMPDIVFNPHGFPSRMTIAMMIECMAGKSGAINGVCHDATPFRFSENDDAIDYFGRQLEVAGYNYYGTETMYSGTKGVEVKADIFFGIIHYQRLRHMVSDKYQVRSQGPVDQVTRQPIKGRRRGGGVRFGEMERDCLLSHGSSFLLQDRLLHGSDKTVVNVCTKCGSLLSPRMVLSARANAFSRFRDNSAMCVVCSANTIRSIQVPFIFLHLISQLASVNIKVRLAMEHY